MSTTLSAVNSVTGLLMNTANASGSALNQITSNNTSTQTTTNTNQLTSTNANLFNLNRGMKENSIFIAAINQINQSTNNKQAIMNGILQQQQNQTKQQLANNLVQQQQFNNSTTTVQQNATTNLQQTQQTANCQQQPFYQQLSALRLKNLHNNSQALLNNQQAMYRAFQSVQQANNSNSLKQQQQHQLINNLNQGVINQTSATGQQQQANTGNILLNISNHNNHTNSHFNHFNQHQTNQTLYNGLPLNYHLQNGQTHHFYHSNSLSSSPRSSTSSNSSTSSSLINYNSNQNGNINKYQQQQQQQQNASAQQQQQHSPVSNNSPTAPVLNTNQQLNNCQNKQLNAQKLKNNQQQQNLNSVQQQTIQGQNGNSSRYKTELCRPFEESGFCKYSDKCQYAHGPAELRSLIRHPKYKTELCKTYHSTGFCPYGRRCNFVHNDNPSTATISSSATTVQTNTLLTATSKKENINSTNLTNTGAILMDSFLSGASTVLNGLNSTNSTSTLMNKATIADLIEINTNAPSSGISSMGSNTNSIDSVGSSPSSSPKQTIFPNLNQQSQQLNKQNSNKLQELILPLSPGLSIGSGNSSPLQQLSSLSSKSDDVFYKYL